MISATVTNTTPDARSLPGRSPDGAQQDDGFDAALADVEQGGKAGDTTTADAPAQLGTSDMTSINNGPDTFTFATSVKMGGNQAKPAIGDAGQGLADLLAKLANESQLVGAQATASVKSAPGAPASRSEAQAKANSQDAADAPGSGTNAVADPLANMATLLTGLVMSPVPSTPSQSAPAAPVATPDPTNLSVALGALPAPKTPGAQRAGTSTEDSSAATPEPGVVLTSVATARHLAPTSTPVGALRGGPGTNQASTATAQFDGLGARNGGSSLGDKSAATSSISALAATASHDPTATAAVATPAGSDAKLPTATLAAIAGAITSLAADTPSGTPATPGSAAAPATPDPTPALVSPARSLTLQLTPGDLGTVTVRLHLTAGGLDVNLAVDDRKTLASISHARDELTSAIGDNGYRVESLVIRGADASSTSTAGSNDSARSQSDAGAGQGSSGGGGSGGDAPSSRQRAPQPPSASRDIGRDRGADGVFV